MLTVKDHLGREVQISNFPPQRIVSLVPSQTELLYDLGLGDRVVGITKFCVHPPHWRGEKTIIGGTKSVHSNRLQKLQPDLILANKEENDPEQLAALLHQYPVWVSDIKTIRDACQLIIDFGEILGLDAQKTTSLAKTIQDSLLSDELLLVPRRPRTAYFIWRKPYMVAGGDTYINSMISAAGFDNVFAHLTRYPEIYESQLSEMQPELILLSSEPYPFSEKHIAVFKEICPQSKVFLVDGEIFSWYGTRMLCAADYFVKLRYQVLG